MAFPIKTCVVCSEEFELKPNKPGFANRCPACSVPDSAEPAAEGRRAAGAVGPTAVGRTAGVAAVDRKTKSELNEARRGAIRDMLYRKES
jgi:hypothetical protein